MKKFLSLAVAALLTVSAVATSATAAKFTDVDVKNDALNDAVELLTALNVTKGVNETEFGTANNVTREQMAAFIFRMMKAGKSVEGGVNNTTFADLDDPTFYFMISWANNEGIIKGRNATTFDPKGGIILQDAYTMIVRALGYDDGTLAYPISYISLAEDLGLDADLPSTLGYTDTLTRGDVAIILANMFYAETAETEIKYESSYKFVCPVHGTNTTACETSEDAKCNPQAVSNGQVPKEYHKTVAEAVFEVEKISQRVIATPNYAFGANTEMPDEDVEMITLSAAPVIDYADYETDIPSLNQVEFADLGLEGSADDYFLHDIVMFVKEVNDGEYEIFGATATGTKTTVSFEDVKFGTVSGTAAEKYYDGSDKEYKMINGKLTLGDTVTYLFGAPYSFSKDANNLDKYNAQFITLGAYDDGRDVAEDVVDVNFRYVLDAQAMDDSLIGANYDDENDVWTLGYTGYLSQVYYNGLGEIDVYDCDGNGKPDYLFVKNYTVGTIDTEEDARIYDENYDATEEVENVVLYTDMAIVEGVEFADKDIVLAYANKNANYVKVAEVLTGKEAAATSQNDKSLTLATGEKIFFQDAKAVVANGAEALDAIEYNDAIDFDNEATYYFAANGTLVYVTGLATAINVNENWVVVLEADTTPTTTMVDGKIEKADYVTIYNDGEIKYVKAKKIEEDTRYNDEDTPYTYDGGFDFSDYVGKLATGKADKNGAYYFDLVDFTANDDFSALESKDDAANEYRQTGVAAKLYKKTGTSYALEEVKLSGDAYVEDTDAAVNALRNVNIKDYTQIIIKSVDKEGEDVLALYTIDNLPDIKKGTVFENVSYVLLNNTNSVRNENLVVFYGEYAGVLSGDPGEVADVRIIKGYSKNSTEDGSVYVYDVFNPFEGNITFGIEAAETDDETPFAKGSIVGLTTEGYIDNSVATAAGSVAMTAGGNIYNVDSATAFEDTTGLGWSTVVEYDETTGYLEVNNSGDNILQVTEDTVVTFLDLSSETIDVVDAEILASTSKNYRYQDVKTNAIRVFLCIEEDDDATGDDAEYFYNVKFAVIVRD